MAFIHVATLRVFVTPGTVKPDTVWVEEQSRAFLDHAAEERLPCSIVICDCDGKFSKAFDQAFKDRSIQIKRVGPQTPNLNAFAKRWIQSLKHEALDHFVVFGQEHFDHIVSSYVDYYHECRPHQGIGNVLLLKPGNKSSDDSTDVLPLDLSHIKCEERLGGVLWHYYHVAT
jgi:putative transposase